MPAEPRPCRVDKIAKELNKYLHNSDHPRFRMAAAIVKKNKILGIGWNRMKSHPFQAKFRKNEDAIFLHAEVHAIKNAIKTHSFEELKGSTMVILRKTTKGYGLAKPCEGCMRALVEFEIGSVFYSSIDGFEHLGSKNVFDANTS